MDKIPSLRFKEFSGEWEEDKLNNLSELIKDGTHGTHENVKNGISLLSAKDIKNGKIQIQKDCRKISLDDFQKIHKNYTLQNNDLLLTIVGTIGEVGIIKNYKNDYTFQRSVGIIRLKKKKLNSDYCFQYFKTEFFQNILKNKANSSAQAGVYLGELSKINIKFSSLQEQEKIGNFLSSVDKKISIVEEKINLFNQYKKGIMQKIFNQELRFKDENGNNYPEWEERKLSEIINYISSGKTLVKSETGKYNLYGSTGKIGFTNKIDYKGENILIARVGANAGTLNFINEECGITDNTLVTSVKNNNSNKWLYYYLIYYNLNRLIFGSGQPLITGSLLKNLKINLPYFEEQKKIADFLSAIDDKIENISDNLESLKLFKKSMLQKMFV